MKKMLMALCLLMALMLTGCTMLEMPQATDTPAATEAPAATEVPVATEEPAAAEAEDECQHAESSWQMGESRAVPMGDALHLVVQSEEQVCAACGAVLHTAVKQHSEAHTFNAEDTCEVCGYSAVTQAETTTEQPKAYLVVTVNNEVYQPIALNEPGRYRITRGDHVNVVEVTEDSVWMAESSCDNQDCVLQGVVSLENKSQRVLQNMIICLPNEVILELFTYDELVVALPGWEG